MLVCLSELSFIILEWIWIDLWFDDSNASITETVTSRHLPMYNCWIVVYYSYHKNTKQFLSFYHTPFFFVSVQTIQKCVVIHSKPLNNLSFLLTWGGQRSDIAMYLIAALPWARIKHSHSQTFNLPLKVQFNSSQILTFPWEDN